MKKMFIAFAMFMSCSLMMWANGVVPTRFDERMDLMAVIWRMAGARELRRPHYGHDATCRRWRYL